MASKPKPIANPPPGQAPSDDKPPHAMQARVLSDVPAAGLRCGDIVQGPPDAVQALIASGDADAHPSAVQHATDTGARVVLLKAET